MEFGVDVSSQAIAAQRSKRVWARNKTLLDLCIKCVLKNSEFFVGRTENPLQNLPNTIVQKFFLIMAQRFDKDSVEAFKPADMPLIFLLLNSNVEEFSLQNLLQSEHVYFAEAQSDDCILDHALRNCPSIRKISISLDAYKKALLEELFTDMSTNWQKLKYLSLEGENILSDSTVCLLAKYLPQLEILVFNEKSWIHSALEESDILPQFTMDSVNKLSRMKKLQFVTFNLSSKVYFDDPIWAHVAGKMPALKKISLENYSNYQTVKNSLFIKHYENLYPGKPLVLESVKISCADFDGEWPQNVTLEKLSLQGHLQSLEILSSLPKGVKFLRLYEMYPHEVHAIVEIFGASIIKLEVYDLIQKSDDLLNINKLLLMCPEMKFFEVFLFPGRYEFKKFDSALPKCVKHLKNFLVSKEGFYELEEVNPLLKQVLLGSENVHWSPHLKLFQTARTILEVLRETNNHCTHYKNLNSFKLKVKNLTLQIQNDFLELAYRLMFTSLLLKHFLVKINVPRVADEVFCKNLIKKCKRLKEVSQILDIKCKVELNFPQHLRRKNLII